VTKSVIQCHALSTHAVTVQAVHACCVILIMYDRQWLVKSCETKSGKPQMLCGRPLAVAEQCTASIVYLPYACWPLLGRHMHAGMGCVSNHQHSQPCCVRVC
jgi:hypothetical protein